MFSFLKYGAAVTVQLFMRVLLLDLLCQKCSSVKCLWALPGGFYMVNNLRTANSELTQF